MSKSNLPEATFFDTLPTPSFLSILFTTLILVLVFGKFIITVSITQINCYVPLVSAQGRFDNASLSSRRGSVVSSISLSALRHISSVPTE